MSDFIEVLIYVVVFLVMGIGKFLGAKKEGQNPILAKKNPSSVTSNAANLESLFDIFKEENFNKETQTKPKKIVKKEEYFASNKKTISDVKVKPAFKTVEPISKKVEKKNNALQFIKSNPRSAFLIKEILSTPKGMENI